MKIQVSDELPLPAEEVFLLIRDRMPELVPFMNEVESITVTKRVDDGETVRIVNLWQGSMDKVPKPIQRFVKPELASWNDHAVWTTPDRTARWHLEPRVGAKVFECSGTTKIQELDEARCRLVMDIDLEVYPERIPGVPKILGRRFRGRIEQTIAGMLTPNIRNLATSIRQWAHRDEK
jgi:hypothetical protein